MPKPYEGWQTYHPPLYYLINHFLAPSIITDKEKHVSFVRFLSVLYGAVSIYAIGWLLLQIGIEKYPLFLSLLFIITQPKFVMLFSTYNNDSLLTMFSFIVIALCYKLYFNWSKKWAIVLLLASTAALYTKYSAILFLGVIVIILCKNLIIKKVKPLDIEIKILKVIFASLFIFSLYWA